MISKVKNDLFDYKNRYIMQMKDGFKFSLDSLLLAEFVNIKKDDKKILNEEEIEKMPCYEQLKKYEKYTLNLF